MLILWCQGIRKGLLITSDNMLVNRLPDIEFLVEEEVVVEVRNGSVNSITISHLHHACSRLALHEFNLGAGEGPLISVSFHPTCLPSEHMQYLRTSTYPLHVAVQTENVEDAVSIHLGWIKTIHHDDWRLCMRAVLPRGRRGRAILSSIPLVWPTSTWTHWRPNTAPLIVAIVMVSMITLWAT